MEPVTKAALKTAQIMVGEGKTWTYIPSVEQIPIWLECRNTVVWGEKPKKPKHTSK